MAGGRPTSFTPAIGKAIVDAVREGNWRTTAAAAAGVHRNTLYNWIEKGDGENAAEPYATFVTELQQAEAECEMDQVAAILSAKPGIPQVSGPDVWSNKTWWLERRYPSRYSGKVRATVDEIVEGMMKRIASVLDAENLEKVRDATRPDSESGSAGEARH